jgi:hypothetical protein
MELGKDWFNRVGRGMRCRNDLDEFLYLQATRRQPETEREKK